MVIHSKTDKGIFLTILNSKTKEVILSNTFLAVERSKNIIKTLLKTNKILNTAQVVEINLETLDIQKYNVYLDNNNITETNLVPFYFLEAIKQEDYNLAISYVDTTLNNVNQSKLKQYFGEIKDIYYNCYNLNKDYCNYTIFSPKPRNFNFYIQNYKILEIEEIELFN